MPECLRHIHTHSVQDTELKKKEKTNRKIGTQKQVHSNAYKSTKHSSILNRFCRLFLATSRRRLCQQHKFSNSMRVIVVASLEYSSVKSKAVATTNEKKINTNEHIEID